MGLGLIACDAFVHHNNYKGLQESQDETLRLEAEIRESNEHSKALEFELIMQKLSHESIDNILENIQELGDFDCSRLVKLFKKSNDRFALRCLVKELILQSMRFDYPIMFSSLLRKVIELQLQDELLIEVGSDHNQYSPLISRMRREKTTILLDCNKTNEFIVSLLKTID